MTRMKGSAWECSNPWRVRDFIHEHNDDEGEDLVAIADAGAEYLVTEAVTNDDDGGGKEGEDDDDHAHDNDEE